MGFRTARTLVVVLSVAPLTCGFGHAMCPVDVVVVKGDIERAPRNPIVRAQLIYPGNLPGDSGEATFVEGSFTIPIEFLTESRKPLLVGTFREKCNRKPVTVIVTLLGGDPSQQYDRVSLSLAADFRKDDSNSYALKTQIVLKGLR